MNRLELHAPRRGRSRAVLSAAPASRAVLTLFVLVFAGLMPAAAVAATPSPDPTPQAPAPSPDPAPGAGQAPAQQEPASPAAPVYTPPATATYVPPSASATGASAATTPPSADVVHTLSPAEARKAAARQAATRRATGHRAAAQRAYNRGHEASAKAASATDPGAIARLSQLATSPTDDNSRELLLAACGLIALLCASASFVSVASRMWRGQLH